MVLVFFTTLFHGCATLSSPKDEKELLRGRVVQFMTAKVAGQWDSVYDFLDPAFRMKVSKKDFLSRQRKITFKSFEIRKLEILPSVKEARVEISSDISMQGYDFKNALEVQHWVDVDNKWYLKIKEPPNPFIQN